MPSLTIKQHKNSTHVDMTKELEVKSLQYGIKLKVAISWLEIIINSSRFRNMIIPNQVQVDKSKRVWLVTHEIYEPVDAHRAAMEFIQWFWREMNDELVRRKLWELMEKQGH